MSKPRWLFGLLVALTLAPLSLSAQQAATITGRVTDEAGAAVPSATVRIQSLGVSAATNGQGNYTLSIPPARVSPGQQVEVSASRVGLATQTRTVTLNPGTNLTQNFQLTAAAVGLEGLVVTALGITREERAVSTSVQEISGAELTETPEGNLVSALSGKVAGATITNSGTQGGSARIVLRGATSLTGNNQPLFVVDGIPVSNAAPTGNESYSGYGAIDYGNVIQDLNPNDIASVSVLKGPNAAALYGSRAANGAILITTKAGRGARGIGVTASTSVTFETPLRLPTYQNRYGQGFNGEFNYVNGAGGGRYDYVDESWGPPLDQGLMIPQFFSNGEPAPWVSHPNNIRDFFETGRTLNTNAAFATSSDRANVRFSVANLDQNGVYPGLQLNRTTVALNGGANLTDRLRTDASVQYIKSDADNRPAQGYSDDNYMMQFIWFGRQVDIGRLRNYRNADGSMNNWNFSYHPNPYWIALANTNTDGRDRIIGSGTVSYDVTPWLTGTVRSGTDWYQEDRQRTYAAGTFGDIFPSVGENGALDRSEIFRRETNTDFLLSANRKLSSDFTATANFGGNRRDSEFRSNGWYVQDLVVPGVYDLDNAAITPFLDDYRERKRVNSLYGQAQFGFRDYLFLDVTGRNDWSSTLPANNNSYFYPSVSGSLVFTDLFPRLPSALSFGKLRASWARVGNDADPYQLASVYVADEKFGAVPRFGASNRIPNAALKPEQTDAWEVGTELRFFSNRLGLEATYYDQSTSNQILPVQISPLTGFTSRTLNAGRITNHGIELRLDATPVRMNNGLEWNVAVNYAKNDNRVAELYGDLETLTLGYYYGLSIEAREGEPYGALYGVGYVRDSRGNVVVNSKGLPIKSSDRRLLGNYNPDWTGGLTNTLRYRGAEFSFLLDTKQGGNVYSLTNNFGRKAGTLIESLRGRETAESLDEGGGLVVPGVKVTAAGDTVPNDIRVSAQAYHRGLDRLHEEYVYDASFVKLREMRLGYAVPASFATRLGVTGLNVALVGRNLALWTDVPNIDPETALDAGNAQGLEYGQVPTARSIGFSISVTP